MNKAIKFMAALMCVAMPVVMSSCSDDDDVVVAPGTNGVTVPEQIGDYEITTNAAGQVTKIDDGYDVVEFEYGTFSRATTYQVKMTKYDKEQPDDKMTIYIKLNGKGYAEHALEVYSDGDEDTWDFGYNSAGQLNYMKRSEGGNEVTEITYANGDITKVSVKDDDNDSDFYTISYTNDSIATAIDNVAGIMLFDDMFKIDMDEMEMAYYAGLLGKATKHLPLKYVEDGDDGENYTDLEWTLNGAKYPTVLIMTEHDRYGTYTDTIYFKW